MTRRRRWKDPELRGWIDVCSDNSWIEHGGMWGKSCGDVWYVLVWRNMLECAGKQAIADGLYLYECRVLYLELDGLTPEDMRSALSPCGYTLEENKGKRVIMSGPEIAAEGTDVDLYLVQCCADAGVGDCVYEATGNKWPLRIRAEARRFAERQMRLEAGCILQTLLATSDCEESRG